MDNPIEFKHKDIIESVYSNKLYKVIEPDKKGMAILLNIETGLKENWNSCNNPHFIKSSNQLKLKI